MYGRGEHFVLAPVPLHYGIAYLASSSFVYYSKTNIIFTILREKMLFLLARHSDFLVSLTVSRRTYSDTEGSRTSLPPAKEQTSM